MTPDVRWKQRFSNFSKALLDMSADVAWMDMLRYRNLISHVYDETLARQVVNDICTRFHRCFLELHDTLASRTDPMT
jgi:uncharacterized protein with HEPN domain